MTWEEWQEAHFPERVRDSPICPEFALAPAERLCNQPYRIREAGVSDCDECRAQQVPEGIR